METLGGVALWKLGHWIGVVLKGEGGAWLSSSTVFAFFLTREPPFKLPYSVLLLCVCGQSLSSYPDTGYSVLSLCVCAHTHIHSLYQIEAVFIAAAAYLCHQSSDVITYHQVPLHHQLCDLCTP